MKSEWLPLDAAIKQAHQQVREFQAGSFTEQMQRVWQRSEEVHREVQRRRSEWARERSRNRAVQRAADEKSG